MMTTIRTSQCVFAACPYFVVHEICKDVNCPFARPPAQQTHYLNPCSQALGGRNLEDLEMEALQSLEPSKRRAVAAGYRDMMDSFV